METKICKTCGKELTFDNFYFNKYYSSNCKSCHCEKFNKYRFENKEKINIYRKKSNITQKIRRQNNEEYRVYYLKKQIEYSRSEKGIENRKKLMLSKPYILSLIKSQFKTEISVDDTIIDVFRLYLELNRKIKNLTNGNKTKSLQLQGDIA